MRKIDIIASTRDTLASAIVALPRTVVNFAREFNGGLTGSLELVELESVQSLIPVYAQREADKAGGSDLRALKVLHDAAHKSQPQGFDRAIKGERLDEMPLTAELQLYAVALDRWFAECHRAAQLACPTCHGLGHICRACSDPVDVTRLQSRFCRCNEIASPIACPACGLK